MPNIFKTIIVFLFVLSIISCSKYLDKNPNDSISSGTFWQNEEDVKMAVTGVYSRLRGGFFGYRRMWLDTYSDNAYDRFNAYNFQNLTMGIVNPTSIPSAFYTAPYQGIAACNYFLSNIDKVSLDESKKNVYAGEIRFLRALFYTDLVIAFGGVIIYDAIPESVDASKIEQSSKEEVLEFIHNDLDFAIANLPNEMYEGHAVKASAQALKARVYLFQENWSKVVELTASIMQDNKFSIAPAYENLFNTSTQIGNPEIIFSTQFLSPNSYHGDFAGTDVELGWFGSIGVYQNLGEEYEMKNGKRITDPGSGYDPTNPAKDRDPRFDITLKYPGEKYINPDGSEFKYSDPVLTPYMMQKYVNLDRLPIGYDKANLTDQHIIHIRYADVLLMHAEARNELSGPDAAIYSALNQIRSRPGVEMPPVDQVVYNTQVKLRECIRHERRIELALEGLRYFDLKRWRAFEEKFGTLKNPAGVQLQFGEKEYVLPFPQFELDRNPNLKQNSGY